MMFAHVALLAGLIISQSEESSREADLFGDAETSTITTATSAAMPVLEQPIVDPLLETTSDREVESKLGTADDILDIGAFFYLRAQYDAREEGTAYKFPLTSSNLLDLYVDGRPSDRVRAFAQARLYYTPTARGAVASIDNFFQAPKELEALLDQLWLKLDLERALFITIGRQRIKWGSGRAWNPTDFLNDVRNPLDIFDARIGQDLIKLHFPVESLGWNFYALGTFSGADTPEKVGGAIRGEFVLGEAELALSAAARKDRPIRFGADISAAIGPFDVHSEVGIQTRNTSPFYDGPFSFEPLLFPELVSRKDDFIVQWVSGAELAIKYSDEDSVYIGGEYFFNDAGYDSAEIYPWLLANGAFTPFYLGRHYAALFTLLPSPGDWDDTTFTLSAIANLSDRSGVVRVDYQVLVLSYLRFNAFVQVYGGEVGEFRFGLEVPPLPLPALPPALQNGLSVPPPLFSAGLGLSVEI